MSRSENNFYFIYVLIFILFVLAYAAACPVVVFFYPARVKAEDIDDKSEYFFIFVITSDFFVLTPKRRPIMSKDRKERLIFVTNDDGFSARGFEAAIEVAREFGRVFAVAPATTQSGRSQAITMYEPLFLDLQRQEEGVEIYSFSGTPTDCVKIAFDNLLKDERVDLVISGINHGSNSAINVLYSGTMGAAIEGSFYGCPAVGLSLTSHDADADFTAAKRYAREIIASVLDSGKAGFCPLCLNVNVPDMPLEDIRGVKVCRQCRGIWREEFFRHEDPRGKPYYWLTGSYTNYEPEAEDTDEWALANGYVSVVPVQVDMTDYGQMSALQQALGE